MIPISMTQDTGNAPKDAYSGQNQYKTVKVIAKTTV